MAFFTNWVLVIQFIYFVFSSFITYKIYQQFQPKSSSNRLQHISSNFDIALSNLSAHENASASQIASKDSPQGLYSIVGKPPDLQRLGYYKMFLFTKSLLEISLVYSIAISVTYWLTIYSGHFKDITQAIYYIQSHGIILILQLFDCYASTYQLRLLYGFLWIFLFTIVGFVWMYLFEELEFTNPFTKKNQLYSLYDWHNETIKTAIIYCIQAVLVLVIYSFIVFTKNIALLSWKGSRQIEQNKELTSDDTDNDSTE